MTKLATTFALVAVLGCRGHKTDDQPKVDDKTAVAQPKPAEQKPDDNAPAKPDDKAAAKPDDKTATPAAGDLPAECSAWKDAVAKLASCDKVTPQTRDTLKQAYDAAAAGWTNVPAGGKARVAAACKTGIEAVEQAASACGK